MINELEKKIKFVLEKNKINIHRYTGKEIDSFLLIIFIYAKYLDEKGKIEIADKSLFRDFFEIANIQKKYDYVYQVIDGVNVKEIVSCLQDMNSIELVKNLKDMLLKKGCYQSECRTLVYHQFYSLCDYPICDQIIDFMLEDSPPYCNNNIISIYKILDQLFSYHRKYYMNCDHLKLTQDNMSEYKKIYLDCNLSFSYRYSNQYRNNIFRLFRFINRYLKTDNSVVVKVSYIQNTKFDYSDIFEHLSLVEIESNHLSHYILHFKLKHEDKIMIKKENSFVYVTSGDIIANYNRIGVNIYQSTLRKKYHHANKLIYENSHFSEQLHYISEEIEGEINKLIERI